MDSPSQIYLPTAFIPSIAYMRLLSHAEEAFIYVGESYRKQSYRNRADLMTANGRASLSIPVEKYAYPPPETSTIMISEHGDWRKRHLQTVISGYGSSPFLEHYIDEIEHLLLHSGQGESLVTYNHRWLEFACDELGLPMPKVVQVLPEGATFIGEVCARDYAPEATLFERYWQVYEDRLGFVPNLSVLDLLLNTGNEAILYLKSSKADSQKLPR
ncbi:WbqC family protein [Porphyromonas sp.]|uniref:WbqC family protein n=1 Tax=Porphyromonas sp. TaxID=1924944 RepID=UPI0026DC15F5|nr:WbqC family protein [Porphyromonas sp.]MDO4770812.1 WbqC family protein [Porphyromonas sp.]